ncbi:MAG: LysM peptidoglycan-binding domain-containing protein [Anaerolineae bacterium]|nr:LysM peptidoglycan-binding domain-containing protein [Anaerolineae bacterium]
MANENIQKATIINLDTGEPFVCQFNPTEYTLRKQNSLRTAGGAGQNNPGTQSTGGQPATLTMKLFFDTTELGTDVRLLTNRLWNLMRVNKDKSGQGEPSKCQFIWGKTLFFTAFITSISQQFIMFRSDGTPVRAKLDVTFQEVKDDEEQEPQNPTSHSEPRRTRVVRPGDRLDLIAFAEYGDASRWLELAQANDLEEPLNLTAGQILRIPLI